MRIPLASDIKTAIATAAAEDRLVNALVEERSGSTFVKKRPGLEDTTHNFSSPQGMGAFPGLLFLIYGDVYELTVAAPAPPSVLIGYMVGGYYAMVDNPSTSPGPGDAYWSLTPPSADRWIARHWSYDFPGYVFNETMPIGPSSASETAAAKAYLEICYPSCPGWLGTTSPYPGYYTNRTYYGSVYSVNDQGLAPNEYAIFGEAYNATGIDPPCVSMTYAASAWLGNVYKQ